MKLIDHKRLAKLMLIQGISARTLASEAGWKSHTYMAKLAKGTESTLKVEPACLIADTLGVGVDDLFLVQTSSETEHIVKHNRRKVAA
ncbi:hypothetical protein ACI3EY_16850 [Ornithinimicrobium sp. LYQ92]|uniref:hypothetical protein n=1 Tax=Serinicoccus sp. LYQ92 TaxID=3378798 RepID=UPI00385417A0